ncbi:MAG TPA: DUF3105 domain-containing protein [Anaerolineaceae bacterium]|nr:DUF3105 domain-containing protein [Anaerolineaceae bacterium]HPN51351.1 DUF3105 domain-containing protein [Anaerolineaceae bacterium]
MKTRSKNLKQKNPQLIWIIGAAVLLVGSLAAFTLSGQNAGLMGDPVAIASAEHVSPDKDPSAYYQTNPPAGGPHFPTDFKAGFYQESDLANLPAYPEGYLVHNLEHGYVIFWYNCAAPGAGDCAAFKQTLKGVMDEFNGVKLIAFPWRKLDVPLAVASWGRLLKPASPDPQTLRSFIRRNLNQAPEPHAD